MIYLILIITLKPCYVVKSSLKKLDDIYEFLILTNRLGLTLGIG